MLAIVQFNSPFTLTEFIWPPGLGPFGWAIGLTGVLRNSTILMRQIEKSVWPLNLDFVLDVIRPT